MLRVAVTSKKGEESWVGSKLTIKPNGIVLDNKQIIKIVGGRYVGKDGIYPSFTVTEVSEPVKSEPVKSEKPVNKPADAGTASNSGANSP